jgi:hypothetical protein
MRQKKRKDPKIKINTKIYYDKNYNEGIKQEDKIVKEILKCAFLPYMKGNKKTTKRVKEELNKKSLLDELGNQMIEYKLAYKNNDNIDDNKNKILKSSNKPIKLSESKEKKNIIILNDYKEEPKDNELYNENREEPKINELKSKSNSKPIEQISESKPINISEEYKDNKLKSTLKSKPPSQNISNSQIIKPKSTPQQNLNTFNKKYNIYETTSNIQPKDFKQNNQKNNDKKDFSLIKNKLNILIDRDGFLKGNNLLEYFLYWKKQSMLNKNSKKRKDNKIKLKTRIYFDPNYDEKISQEKQLVNLIFQKNYNQYLIKKEKRLKEYLKNNPNDSDNVKLELEKLEKEKKEKEDFDFYTNLIENQNDNNITNLSKTNYPNYKSKKINKNEPFNDNIINEKINNENQQKLNDNLVEEKKEEEMKNELKKLTMILDKNLKNKGLTVLEKNNYDNEVKNSISKLDSLLKNKSKYKGLNALQKNKKDDEIIKSLDKLNNIFENKSKNKALNNLKQADEKKEISNVINIFKNILSNKEENDMKNKIKNEPQINYEKENYDDFYEFESEGNYEEINEEEEEKKMRGWTFIKISSFLQYQRLFRNLKKRFAQWKKESLINTREDNLNYENEFEH